MEATPIATKQEQSLKDLEATIPKVVIARWLEVIRLWDDEPDKKGKPSPYRPPVISTFSQ